MSVCKIIASDIPLVEYIPSQDYPLTINVDKGTIYDGFTDDNYYLKSFPNVQNYTNKEYAVSLEWEYTDGRAEQIIAKLSC